MQVKTRSAKRTVIDFLREEAPLEYERLRSISQLASTLHDVTGDRSDLSQFSYARWVRDALGRCAI